MRGRPREYDNRYQLTVSVEKDLWNYAQDYKILGSDAISYGLQGLIESDIIKTKKATSEEIDRYLEIKSRELKYCTTVRDRERHAIEEITSLRDEANRKRSEQVEPQPTPDTINWAALPEDQKTRVYIQKIFTPEERAFWISRYLAADEDDQPTILKQFVSEFVTRFTQDEDRPFNKVDAGEVKRVLRTWAESQEGF